MVRWPVLLGALTGALLLTACRPGPHEATRSFRLSPGDERVFEAYGQTATTAHHQITLEPGTRHVRVRIDCVNARGEVTVDVLAGNAVMPCSARTRRPAGVVGLEWRTGFDGSRLAAVRVHAPRGAEWSVAVDAGPGAIDPAGD